MLKINVITQLIVFFTLATLINLLPLNALWLLSFTSFSFLLYQGGNRFAHMLKRFKWLLLVMMIIFTFNTPGEHIQDWPFYLNPTYEGLVAGVTQVLRMMVILAIITWIMAVNTKQQLISGFYFMLTPFRLIGLKADRFSARLWLTLHYVELQQEVKSKETLITRLQKITSFDLNEEQSLAINNTHNSAKRNMLDVIVFNAPKFQLIDFVALFALLVVLILALL